MYPHWAGLRTLKLYNIISWWAAVFNICLACFFNLICELWWTSTDFYSLGRLSRNRHTWLLECQISNNRDWRYIACYTISLLFLLLHAFLSFYYFFNISLKEKLYRSTGTYPRQIHTTNKTKLYLALAQHKHGLQPQRYNEIPRQ